MAEARHAWLRGNKQPLLRCLQKKGGLKQYALSLAVILWPASHAALALRLRGDVLPDEMIGTRA
jgi:hypothetical protein